MGVESIELDTVNLRMVARTLPGKQFEVGRGCGCWWCAALRRGGIATAARRRTGGRGNRPSGDRRGRRG